MVHLIHQVQSIILSLQSFNELHYLLLTESEYPLYKKPLKATAARNVKAGEACPSKVPLL